MRGTTGITKSHSSAGACQFVFWRVRISGRRFKPVLLSTPRGPGSDRFRGNSRASAHGRVPTANCIDLCRSEWRVDADSCRSNHLSARATSNDHGSLETLVFCYPTI